ncbi:tetratricopeptide repeat protein [Tautonia plasticadhaerens]|uniref:Serine/threonine-protein kinase pkn5 n=1 Tax=Tautonia plasticadhaerens TaxID=2527974 RepID=A0A518GX65_9BACT|nr:tetratricopeptide repeat protein [Tautonia plasticadhaerens]QDV33163.1 Serine/threonine-protein kinase pkn5 [Tautonia plasticadhaerens]
MSTSGSRSEIVLRLAEEFLDRYRGGQRPSLQEYIDRHPELAGEIREVFPAMAMMEQIAIADESLAGDPTGPAPSRRDAPLEQLGDYRILREIGRGGMGVVYEAEQESLGRHVALKVLPPHALRDPVQVRRFEREARAAARLHHTNIVPVFGVGEEAGTYYYVMQYIQGQSLDEVLLELRRLRKAAPLHAMDRDATVPTSAAAPPSAAEVARSLWTGRFTAAAVPEAGDVTPTASTEAAHDPGSATTSGGSVADSSLLVGSGTAGHARRSYSRRVARLGIQVAEALAHAAEQGITHRDIKPSNLLLDIRGAIWVTDFGLAKSAGQDDLTHTGDLVGTLRYMAPERLHGQADHRSDLYALGLTLYELLTLRPAFGESDRGRLVDSITRTDPPRLTRVDPTIRRDLATIVHKAMAKQPADRYQTAAELAADLERYLEDRPIKARPLSIAGVAWRWCRRNPAVASLLGIITLLLMGVAAGSVAAAYRFNTLAAAERSTRLKAVAASLRADQQAERADQAADLANRRAAEAEEARALADLRATEARAVVDFLVNDMLASPSPEQAQGETVTVSDVLERAAERVGAQFADQPLIEASIRHTLGQTFEGLGQYEEAENHLARAVELRTEHLGAEHLTTCESSFRFGWVLFRQGQNAKAQEHFEDLLEICRREYGPEHENTLNVMNGLAAAYYVLGRFGEALALHEEALEIKRRTLDPEDPGTLVTMNNLANVYRSLGRIREARDLYAAAVEVERRIRPNHPGTPLTMQNLAITLDQLGHREEAAALLKEAMESRLRILGYDHHMTRDSIQAYLNHLENFEEDRAFFEKQIARARREKGPEDPETLFWTTYLADQHRRRGDLEEARVLYDRVLAGRRRALGPDHRDTISTLGVLAGIAEAQGDPEKAERLLTDALEAERSRGPDRSETIRTANRLARLMAEHGKTDEAEALLERGRDDCLRSLGFADPTTHEAISILFSFLREHDRDDQALALAEDTQQRARRELGLDDQRTYEWINILAGVHQARDELEEAQRLYEEAAAGLSRTLRADHAQTIATTLALSELMEERGLHEPADARLDQVIESRTRTLGFGRNETKLAILTRLKRHFDRGDFEEGRAFADEVLERCRASLGSDDSDMLWYQNALALLYRNHGSADEARAILDEVIATARRRLESTGDTPTDPLLTQSLGMELARARAVLGKLHGPGKPDDPSGPPSVPVTIEAPYRPESPVADGTIGPEEYGPALDVSFDDDRNPGRMYRWLDPRGKARDDLSFRIMAAYSDASLFLAVQVRDSFLVADPQALDPVQSNDHVEVFINGDLTANDHNFGPASPPSGGADFGSREGFQLLADTAGNQYTGTPEFTNDDWTAGASTTEDGYVIEFEIPLDLIDTRDGPESAPAAPGALLLMNIAITDNDDVTNRQMSYAILWSEDPALSPYVGGEDTWPVGLHLVP